MASNEELENFRAKWRAEVSARTTKDSSASSRRRQSQTAQGPAWPRGQEESSTTASLPGLRPSNEDDDDHVYHHFEHGEFPQRRGSTSTVDDNAGETNNEPQSALEHYEKAVEQETQGRLGDSLKLYRKAYKMDHAVDKKYKSKHFPPSSFPLKPSGLNPSDAAPTVPNTAHHSLDGPPQSIRELITSFADLAIEGAPPAVENTPAPPCPIAQIPEEILVEILLHVAVNDIAEFVRLGLVCKRLAYLVTTEQNVWRRVCQGSEFGFAAMHYTWQREVSGEPLIEGHQLDQYDLDYDDDAVVEPPTPKVINDEVLLRSVYASSWLQMFRLRPRIRFDGCYISTVNYIRPGQADPSHVTLASPVHIVTYYRYLRFFRDGTVISLLTTTQPADVVHYLTKELLQTHKNGAGAHLPSIVMSSALPGRWRLSSLADNPDADMKDIERDVFVETEGVGPKYTYRLDLSMQNAGKGRRNNKLVWKAFYSYNKLTDDLARFGLRNDRPFVWSRVKSYGQGQ